MNEIYEIKLTPRDARGYGERPDWRYDGRDCMSRYDVALYLAGSSTNIPDASQGEPFPTADANPVSVAPMGEKAEAQERRQDFHLVLTVSPAALAMTSLEMSMRCQFHVSTPRLCRHSTMALSL